MKKVNRRKREKLNMVIFQKGRSSRISNCRETPLPLTCGEKVQRLFVFTRIVTSNARKGQFSERENWLPLVWNIKTSGKESQLPAKLKNPT